MVKKFAKPLLYGILFLFIAIIVTLTVFTLQAYNREKESRHEAAPSTGRFIQTSEGEIFIQEKGPEQGQPVLFVSGFFAWSGAWTQTLEEVSEQNFRAIALDLPPFGFSQSPANKDFSNLAQARRIKALIETLELKSVILVGHSNGGSPAMETYFTKPELFKALVLVNTGISMHTSNTKQSLQTKLLRKILETRPINTAIAASTVANPSATKYALQKFIYDPQDASPETIAIYQQPFYAKGNTDSVSDWLPILVNTESSLASSENNYKNIDIQTNIIWGEKDTTVPLSQGEYLAQIIPNAQLHTIPNIGHIPHIEDNVQFNEVLLGILNKHK